MLLLRTTTTVLEAHCYVVAPHDGAAALVVDPGAGSAPEVRRLLAEHGLQVGAVALTHAHADHLWDAAAVAGDAPVYVAPPDLYRLDDPAGALGEPLATLFQDLAVDPWRRPTDVRPLPGELFSGGGAEIVPGVTVRAVPAPGHTEGSTVLLLSGAPVTAGAIPTGPDVHPDATGRYLVALCGDVIFAGSVGRTDLPGGDEREMIATLRTLSSSLAPTTVLLPGHGPSTVLSRELAANPHVRAAFSAR
ncbi:glyoxylase-like metal-dependent hydrolase (beta-lactamase superfamily II) [Georgenia soli]|uniref:Glyoxylase-like metal-dependent hydrolase (Beta-lactamase superfamily II) n=1 Tax=Georgenia soli TaxID=638953 RepID=A0A2A9EGB0_9MICO|nr:MBL fold metallo-hydrolase [Georgenia soli]PFG37958.1 glyoxylase-like metal-dependent hydrolase (beta-lactamase superfamily II) [Georgenia soli]